MTAPANQSDLYLQLFEETSKKLDKIDRSFDKQDSRFDKIDANLQSLQNDDLKAIYERLTRIEAANVGARLTAMEDRLNKTENRMTRTETILLPITALGGAAAAGLISWLLHFAGVPVAAHG